MQELRAKLCAICGEASSASYAGFLVAENSWEDKLIILQWNEPMASREGIQVACSVDHAQELVVRWMTTGSLILWPEPRWARAPRAVWGAMLGLISVASGSLASWRFTEKAWNECWPRTRNR
jgi:hypothetical protein